MTDENKRECFISELFQYYHKELMHSARKKLPSHEDAEDVVNEVWYMATVKADSLFEHPNKIAWLYTALDICVHRFHAKRQRAVMTVPLESGEFDMPAAENHEIGEEELVKYRKILTDMEYKYIHYKFDEEMNNQEIAEKVNRSYSAITSLGNRVRKKIKKYFKET